MTNEMTLVAAQVGNNTVPRNVSLRRLLRTPLGIAALVADTALLLLAVLAPIVWGRSADAYNTAGINLPASSAHTFGTDGLGRDLLLRVLVASQFSLELALGATLIGVFFGLLLGSLPIVTGARVGRFIVAAFNILVAFPGLILAIFFSSIFGIGATGAMLALGVASAPVFARLTHTLSAGVAGRDFVSAARMVGAGRLRIIVRHILPNIGDTLIVNVAMGAGGMLLAFAGLSFLGLGVQPPSFDWGRMLQDGLQQIYINPMAALGPGLAIVLAGLALNLTGEAAAQLAGRRVSTGRRRWLPSGLAKTGTGTNGPSLSADGPVLVVENLTVRFPGPGGRPIMPVRGVSFEIAAGECVGIVGESGSGKSLTALAVAQLIQPPGDVEAGRLLFDGEDLQRLPRGRLRRHLATSLSMVFQDPMSSLNPVRRIGVQLAEVAVQHGGMSRRAAAARAVDRLGKVGVPAPGRRARQYPYEFSGGMRQRAMIAMGLMLSPTLLIADEPTTALDVTVQKQVLELIAKVRAEENMAVLLISHDLAVVSAMCDRVLVMYAGQIVESISAATLLAGPRHPYTRALLAAVPDLQTDRSAPLATIPGRPPSPAAFGTGCAFRQRCPYATDRCSRTPEALSIGGDTVSCWHPRQSADGAPRAVEPDAGASRAVSSTIAQTR